MNVSLFLPKKSRTLAEAKQREALSEIFDVLKQTVAMIEDTEKANMDALGEEIMQDNLSVQASSIGGLSHTLSNLYDTNSAPFFVTELDLNEDSPNQKTAELFSFDGGMPQNHCDSGIYKAKVSPNINPVRVGDGKGKNDRRSRCGNLLDTSKAQPNLLQPALLSETISKILDSFKPKMITRNEFCDAVFNYMQRGVGPPIGHLLHPTSSDSDSRASARSNSRERNRLRSRFDADTESVFGHSVASTAVSSLGLQSVGSTLLDRGKFGFGSMYTFRGGSSKSGPSVASPSTYNYPHNEHSRQVEQGEEADGRNVVVREEEDFLSRELQISHDERELLLYCSWQPKIPVKSKACSLVKARQEYRHKHNQRIEDQLIECKFHCTITPHYYIIFF